ncbi:ArsR family transcriptional regulator [Thermococcus sp. CX2]|uniref:helix-turn-helix transcriptional regulator n=1 Tax=Thermococcus sp. CX2 TaxID=163006 RepID=UPI00143CC03C|nr:helix-turn-helix transcriptional regulator [Thermococcus sp. CX2]NJE85317.1 ArsR family transcriptional regulator [Thermococcus sp. CX2]
MFGRRKDVVYKILATKRGAVALQNLSEELETPMPTVLKTVKQLESDGLVEIFYGQEKASIMVRAKTLEDYI